MSEFQQYQFRTIDEALNQEQKKRISALSSRSQVTSTSATFVYHYSDFRGNVEKLMTDDFDAMLYVSNWGTMRLMFRFPKSIIDTEAILQYAIVPNNTESSLDFFYNDEVLVLDLTIYNEDGGGWMEEDDYSIGDFTPLRKAIIEGDYRMLYLTWVKIAQESNADEDLEDEEISHPPIPNNLKKLDTSLFTFAKTFGINIDMVMAAASFSDKKPISKIDHIALLANLTNEEKNDFLIRLLDNETHLSIKLKKHLESSLPSKNNQNSSRNISLKELRNATSIEETKRLEKERVAALAAHIRRMDQIARDEELHWKSFHFNVDKKSGRSYDEATATLKDLSDMYMHRGKQKEFDTKLKKILEGISSKALLDRFSKLGLI